MEQPSNKRQRVSLFFLFSTLDDINEKSLKDDVDMAT